MFHAAVLTTCHTPAKFGLPSAVRGIGTPAGTCAEGRVIAAVAAAIAATASHEVMVRRVIDQTS
jgi:hypothetical protein